MRDASFYGQVQGLPPAATVPAHFWLAPMPAKFDAETSGEPTLKVYANEGRWIAECPACHGAQLACFEDQRFMCNECGNLAVGGLWRALEWPAARVSIEAVLEARPTVNQNWLPGETLAELKAENALHLGRS